MPKPIERVTMFKIPKEDDREKLLNQYKVLKMTAFKVPCAQGWTLACKTTFASKDDMDYYDNQCEAHKALKTAAKDIREDVMTVCFESGLDE